MNVRKMNVEDLDDVKAVIQAALFDIYGPDVIDWEDFGEYDIIFVAEDGEKIVGCAAIKKVDDKWAKLKRLYILPEFQRKGVGNKLLSKCISFCRESNFERFILTTYPEMENAVKFYGKNGFEVVKNPSDKYFTDPSKIEYNKRQTTMEMML